MERVPAVASVGCKGTPGQAVALPGNVRPSRGVVHTPRKREATSGQAVMLPKPHNNMEIRSLEGILSAAVIHVTLHGRVSNGQITILKVVMERGWTFEGCRFWRILRGARITWFLGRVIILKVVMERVPFGGS